MPFISEKPLEEYIHVDAVEHAVRDIAGDGGQRLQRNVKALTPVGDGGKTRIPGTLRESWLLGETLPTLSLLGHGYGVRLFTNDPIAKYVEWDTRPHNIPNAFGFGDHFGLHGPFEGFFHPGTTGQHMMSRGSAQTVAELDQITAAPLARFREEVVR